MNALITGGAGFIGSHLAEALLAAGQEVIVVDDLSTGSEANFAALLDRPGFTFVPGSVRDAALLEPLVDRCDVIFHLAAAVGVRLIVDRPVHTIETNIHGTEVVLALAAKYRRRILLASSSEVYGKNTKVPFHEDDDTTLGSTKCTRWSYACSKMVDEYLALAYHQQEGLETILCRFFNTVGPRQTGQYGMVVPRFVQRALRNEPIDIYGDGRQSRCFCHVADVVRALGQLIRCDAAIGEIINVGADVPITIRDLAEKIIELTGSSSELRYRSYEEVYGRPFDDLRVRRPDLTKLRRLIAYETTYSLEEILRDLLRHERRK